MSVHMSISSMDSPKLPRVSILAGHPVRVCVNVNLCMSPSVALCPSPSPSSVPVPFVFRYPFRDCILPGGLSIDLDRCSISILDIAPSFDLAHRLPGMGSAMGPINQNHVLISRDGLAPEATDHIIQLQVVIGFLLAS